MLVGWVADPRGGRVVGVFLGLWYRIEFGWEWSGGRRGLTECPHASSDSVRNSKRNPNNREGLE